MEAPAPLSSLCLPERFAEISGTARAKIEALQKTAATGNDAWKAARAELDRTSGSMAILSQTITGLRSTMEDARSALYRAFAASMVDQEKASAEGATKAFEAMTPVAEHLGYVLADLSVTDAPTDWVGFLDTPLKAVIARVLQAKEVMTTLISVTAAVTAGFVAFATATAAAAFVGFVSKGSGMITVIARGVIETAKWPVEIYKLITAQIAQATSTGAVTSATRAQIIATVLAKEAVKGYTATLTAARAVMVAFATSPLAWIATAVAAFYLWYQSAERVIAAQMQLIQQHNELVKSMAREREGIASVDDKINVLTKRYEELRKAREAWANAKTPEERRNAKMTMDAAWSEVQRTERIDERKLKPSDDRKKSEDELKKLHMDAWEDQATALEKLATAQKKLTGAIDERAAATRRLLNAEDEARASDDGDINKKIITARSSATAADERVNSLDEQINAVRGGEDTEAEERLMRERNAAIAERDRFAAEADDLTKRKRAGVGVIENARKDEATKKVAEAKAMDEVTAANKGVLAFNDKRSEFDAEAKIANLKSEGFARVREEYNVQQALTTLRIQQAKLGTDANKVAELELQQLQRKVAFQRQEREEKKADEGRNRETREALAERKEAQQTRAIDRAEARGQITSQQADEMRARVLEGQLKRVQDDAARLLREAKDAESKGDAAGADKAAKESIEKTKSADTIQSQIQDLRDPMPTRRGAVADNMRRVGGGGGAYYAGGGKNPLETKMDRQIKLNEDILASLKRLEEKKGGLTVQ